MAPFISCCAGVCVQRVTATTAATAPVHVSDSDEELEAGGLPAARGFRAGAREIDDVLRDMHRAQRFHLARGIVEAQHGDPTTVRAERDSRQINTIISQQVLLVYNRYRVNSRTGRVFMVNNLKPSTRVCSWSTPLLHELTATFTKVNCAKYLRYYC